MRRSILSFIVILMAVFVATGCSNNKSTTPPNYNSDTIPPSRPSNLVTTPVSSTQINVTWEASADNTGVVGYEVWRNDAEMALVSATSFTDSGLVTGFSYSYFVKAYDAAGNKSAASDIISATTLTTITVVIQGTVDAIDNSLGLLDSSVFTGCTITATYKLNLAATRFPYPQTDTSDYLDAFGSNDISITVGNYTFKSGSFTQLTITNDSIDDSHDGWSIYFPSPSVIGPSISSDLAGMISLYDPTGSAASSTDLLPVPQLTSYASKRIAVARLDGSGLHLFIAGEITELKMVQ